VGALNYLPTLNSVLPYEKVMAITKEIQNSLYELGSAELEELNLIKNYEVTPKEYLSIVKMKAADVESYTKIGAIVGGGTENEINILGQFGRSLGIITILRDDIEDTFNDKFELLSRVLKESLPLPIIYSLQDPACVKILKSISEKSTVKELNALLRIVKKNHGFEKTKNVIETNLLRINTLLLKLPHNKKLVALFR